MVLSNSRLIIFAVIGFLSQKGLSPRTNTNQKLFDAVYDECKIQVQKAFGPPCTSCIQRARKAILELCITDDLSEYARKYYEMIAKNLIETNVPTIREFCDSLKPHEKIGCFDSLVSIFKELRSSSANPVFSEDNKFDCLLTAYYYTKHEKVLNHNNVIYGRYFERIHAQVQVIDYVKGKNPTGLLTPNAFCKMVAAQKVREVNSGEVSTSNEEPDTVLRLSRVSR